MRYLLLLSLTLSYVLADLELSGHLDVEAQAYLIAPDEKHASNLTLKQTLELRYGEGDLSGYAKLYAQEDSSDFLKETKKNERTFFRVDELYARYDLEDDALQMGKSIKYWGALELVNIVDVFNPRDLRTDIFNSQKLGVWNISYSHFSEDGELSLVVKLNEADQKMAADSYVYYFLPQFLHYDEHLQTSNGRNYPSTYLSYSSSVESEYAFDYALILEHGYDSQRYFSRSVLNPLLLHQNSYLVNKVMAYSTLVVDTTLLKLELLYADVIEDKSVGDYSHIAFGFEYTIENIYDKAGLGIIAEYYRYDSYESDKYDDIALYETMQNDIFIGARYSFNNSDDTSVVGGIVHDVEYDEQVYYMEYESRMNEDIKIALDYYYIEPSKSVDTAYASLGRHQRIGLNIAYYF